jgi:excisionase family DNA binding protein
MAEVTVLEAARCLGISPDTVRRRISSGELKARREPHGANFTWWVEIPNELVSPQLGEVTEEELAAPRGVEADGQAAATTVDAQAQLIAAL